MDKGKSRILSTPSKLVPILLTGILLLSIVSMTSCQANPTKSTITLLLSPTTSLTPKSTLIKTKDLTVTPFPRIPTITPVFLYVQNPGDATPIPVAEITARWLKGIPCSPPCWEGVTPGNTTALDAAKIWSANPLFRKVQIQPDLRFEMNVASPHLYFGGETFYYYYKNEPIQFIMLDVGFEGVHLADLIQAFGQPTNIIADIRPTRQDPSANEWYLNIIWASKGFSIADVRAEIPHPESIDENTSLPIGNYFPPGLDSFRKTAMSVDGNGISYVPVPWHGYDSFEKYFEETRNATLTPVK